MTEEEKEAIKYLELLSNEKCECEACQHAKKEYKTISNLIKKQQKEIEREKQYTDFYKDLCNKQQKEIKKYKRYFKLAISDLQSEGYMQMPYENIEEYYSKREDIV